MTLILVGTPIGNLGDLSPRAAEVLAGANLIACEDTRRTRALLSHLGIPGGGRLVSVHEENEATRVDLILSKLGQGQTVAVVSDAGMPAVSDPGQRLVRAAIAGGFSVEVVPGPSAVLAALVLSGMDTSRFCFEGFLPRKGRDRAERLAVIGAEQRTTVLFEAPPRVRSTIDDLIRITGGDRLIAIARELTKRFESVWRGTLTDAVAHLDADEPRGEFVLVLAGCEPPAPPDEPAIAAALATRMAAGDELRLAVAVVTAALGAPRNQVYAIALDLGPDDGDEDLGEPAPH